MTDRVPAAVAVVSSIIIVGYACATTPTTTTNPGGVPSNRVPVAVQPMPGGAPGGPGGERVHSAGHRALPGCSVPYCEGEAIKTATTTATEDYRLGALGGAAQGYGLTQMG